MRSARAWLVAAALACATASLAAAADQRWIGWIALPLSSTGAQLTEDAPTWSLSNSNGSVQLRGVAVPGSVTQALVAHGVAGDPLVGLNEHLNLWIGLDDWQFETRFTLPPDIAATHEEEEAGADLELLLDGLDTLADVLVDGQLLLTAQNFHRRYRVPFPQQPDPAHAYTLAVRLRSPVRAARARHDAYARMYEVPSNPTPRAWPHYNFIRKPASDFGWDWGPATAPLGIHGPITLLASRAPRLTGVHVQQLHDWAAGRVTLSIECEVAWPARWDGGGARLEAELSPPEDAGGEDAGQGSGDRRRPAVGAVRGEARRPERAAAAARGRRGSTTTRVTLTMVLEREGLQLWWPHGHGPQPLYKLQVTLVPGNATCGAAAPDAPTSSATGAAGGGGGGGVRKAQIRTVRGVALREDAPCSVVTHRVGVRDVRLVTEPLRDAWKRVHGPGQDASSSAAAAAQNGTDDRSEEAAAAGSAQDGESFFFQVNQVPVYVRGANMIPLDVEHTRAARPEGVRALLAQALRANMNMLRVWGGGLYQVDELYEFCDEHGLLVWQEFMFACAPYPRVPDQLDEAVLEAQEVVRRLGHHASVTIWGGNNEVEASFSWYPSTSGNVALYASDFDALFTSRLKQVVNQLDPSRPYVDTSPSNGLHVAGPEPIKRWGDPQDPRFGDVHFYQYDGDCQDPAGTRYPRAKFVSESGWQSAPGWAAVSRVTGPGDWDLLAPGMQFRQRHEDGDQQMLHQLALHFRLPAQWARALRPLLNTSVPIALANRTVPGPPDPVPNPIRSRPESTLTVTTNGSARPSIIKLTRHLPTRDDPPPLFLNWIFVTQVQQALCMGTAVARWRAFSDDPTALTMGVLYWQLNDISPFYSWSSLDLPASPGDTPRWKPLQYQLARQWAPLAVLTRLVADGAGTGTGAPTVQVNVTSSVNARLEANLTLRLVPLDSSLRRRRQSEACGGAVARASRVLVAPFAAVPVWDEALDAVLASHPGCTPATCFVSVEATWAPVDDDEDGGDGGQRSHGGSIEVTRHAGNASAWWRGEERRAWARAPHLPRGAWWRLSGGGGGALQERRPRERAGVSFAAAGLGTEEERPAESVDVEWQEALDGWPAGEARRAHGQLWLRPFKDLKLAAGATQLGLIDWAQPAPRVVCFTVTAPVVTPLLVLDAPEQLQGFFSDNLLTLDPCQPQRLCFRSDGPGEEAEGPALLDALRRGVAGRSLLDALALAA